MKNLINKETKGITLIALVITIVILIILAGVLVNITIGDNGLFTKAKLAKQRYEYAEAKEIVDIKLVDIQAECITEKIDYDLKKISEEMTADTEITIEQMYLNPTSLIKEGINPTTYTNLKGIVVSANVHPQFKFLIGEEGNVVKVIGVTTKDVPEEWNGDLPDGFLPPEDFEKEVLGGGKANEEQIEIGENLTVNAKETNTNNLSRKTNIKFEDLFDTVWQQDGKGTQTYSVSGTLEFNNTEFTSNILTNVSQLELGTYRVTYTARTPGEIEKSAYKDVTISSLAQDGENTYAIYSSYDLAKFRDMVNEGQTSINAIQKSDLNLEQVCSQTIGSWIPIGESNFYLGTYDGGNFEINNVYLYNTSDEVTARGLFSRVGYAGIVKNIKLSGNIISLTSESSTGGIVGKNNGTILNCENSASVTGYGETGGICAKNYNTIRECTNKGLINPNITVNSLCAGGIVGGTYAKGELLDNGTTIGDHATIEDCINEGIVYKKGNYFETDATGGIVGYTIGNVEIINCHNKNNVTSAGKGVGGIVGCAKENTTGNVLITRCSNTANISSTGAAWVGGIAGDIYSGTINQCYNSNCSIIGYKENYCAGGIAARSFNTKIQNCYSYLNSDSRIYACGNVGGIVGVFYDNGYGPSVIQNCYVIGDNILSEDGEAKGSIVGYIKAENSEIKNVYYLSNKNEIGEYEPGVTLKTKTITKLDESTLNKAELATLLNNGSSIWIVDNTRNNGYPILNTNKAKVNN